MHRHTARRRGGVAIARLVQVQGLVTLAMTGIGALMSGSGAALSALLGGLVSLIPSLYFAWRIGSVRGGRQARRFVSNFYRAEAGKFGLTVALLAAVFVTAPPSNPIYFFVAYMAVLLAHWLAPWLMRDKPAP
ncbi:F0F1 ATP synthase assembly protein I [Halomonas sp. MCCC 1A11036]|jgi:ATP synthase protein I|uniref:F0F1 ATP synthase assembly protein I n=2 Tax=Billgrantia TaxID=3137761 RepID=A0A6I6SWN5_9GAMM|nr:MULTISPECIES: ATP synthase subunit I [Halomonas]MCE8018658.1 F0F1 ATP synthase assembly protein I [Halomonas zhangzhouensis]MCE8035242.1 F0F1 ATP synthase assembly protein I [Halomonas sp. MCCC 1A11057]QHC51943.1 F0F1 ATP synthase assembly protein I [Halomonas tianxiuensis]